MYVNLGKPGPEPSSELILDFVEDKLGGDTHIGNSSPLLYDAAHELHDACEDAARDALLNPSCPGPQIDGLNMAERQRRAAAVICTIHAEYLRDGDNETVTMRAWCGQTCLLRPKAIADPGELVIGNTYPVVIENFRNSHS